MSDLLSMLREEQYKRCAYMTREGDGKRCDCKYSTADWLPSLKLTSEMTGCPELRQAIQVLVRIPS